MNQRWRGPAVFGGAVFLVGCGVWGVIAGPLPKPALASAGSTRTLTVSRATFPSTWPLTVDSAILACPEANVTTLTAGGIVYALSPEAELTGRYTNMAPITAGNITQPGIADGITELADEGETLC